MDGKIRLMINCKPAESDIDNNVDCLHTNQKSQLSSPSPKRRRAFDKRVVVSFPTVDADGSHVKGAGESTPPTDSWSWRKYGQKPIKGSPYPRGYYRCSSWKGCPARKQVERSSVDPTTMVVTYSCDHNHPWPLPKSSNSTASRTNRKNPDPTRDTASPPEPDNSNNNNVVSEDGFSDLIADEAAALTAAGPGFWFSDVGPAASPDADVILAPPVFGAGDDELALEECGGNGGCGEDDVLFEGLGELPECSVVFRRSYAERQLAAG